MRNLISQEEIKETQTYKTLNKACQYIVCKRETRVEISNAVQIFKNTKEIPPHFAGWKLQVIKDLLNFDKGIDYSNAMTAEDIKLYNV